MLELLLTCLVIWWPSGWWMWRIQRQLWGAVGRQCVSPKWTGPKILKIQWCGARTAIPYGHSTVCYRHGAFQGLWLIQLFNIAIFHSYGYVNQRLNPTRLIIPKRVSTGQGPLRWCPSWPSVMDSHGAFSWDGLWSLMVFDQITTAGVVPNQYANHGAGIFSYLYPINVPVSWVNLPAPCFYGIQDLNLWVVFDAENPHRDPVRFFTGKTWDLSCFASSPARVMNAQSVHVHGKTRRISHSHLCQMFVNLCVCSRWSNEHSRFERYCTTIWKQHKPART